MYERTQHSRRWPQLIGHLLPVKAAAAGPSTLKTLPIYQDPFQRLQNWLEERPVTPRHTVATAGTQQGVDRPKSAQHEDETVPGRSLARWLQGAGCSEHQSADALSLRRVMTALKCDGRETAYVQVRNCLLVMVQSSVKTPY